MKSRTISTKEPYPKRPGFPDGYGFRSDTPHEPQAWQSVVEQIRNSRNYWICTSSQTRKPHAMPVWGVWVKGRLYFITKRASKKAKNLYANAQVVVHLESGDDLVVLEGKAKELEDSQKTKEVGNVYTEKYEGDEIFPEIEAVFELHTENVFTWLEKDFHKTATKWVFENKENEM